MKDAEQQLLDGHFEERISSLEKQISELKAPSCPPHNLIDHGYEGAWAGSVPPPNKICTKCLMTLRV